MISLKCPNSPKLKPYKVQELLFSLFRSKIAYENETHIKNIIAKKDLNVFSQNLMSCNKDIRSRMEKLVNSIVDDMKDSQPIFYDGTHNTNNKRDSQGYLIWKNNTIYISFRGTYDFNDICDVINIRPKKFIKNAYVHSGFADQFMAIEHKITHDIKTLAKDYPIERLVFTGHSMGGSIASIAAAYYGSLFDNLYITCHTFGTPLTGNSEFVNWFINSVDECTRLELEHDIVPLIPINKDFKHIPNGVRLKEKGIIENCYEVIPVSYLDIILKLCKNKKNEIDHILFNHSCEQYTENLLSIKHVKNENEEFRLNSQATVDSIKIDTLNLNDLIQCELDFDNINHIDIDLNNKN